MKKLFRFSIYIFVLLSYNITAIYTSSVHDHQFTWTEEESCAAYIISASQNSDTYPFSINHNLSPSEVNIFNFQSLEFYANVEIKKNILSRAPPSINS